MHDATEEEEALCLASGRLNGFSGRAASLASLEKVSKMRPDGKCQRVFYLSFSVKVRGKDDSGLWRAFVSGGKSDTTVTSICYPPHAPPGALPLRYSARGGCPDSGRPSQRRARREE